MSSKLKQITGLTIRDFGIGMLNISHPHEEFIPDLRQECSNDVTIEILLQSDSMVGPLRSDYNNDNIHHDPLDQEGHLD